MARSKKTSAPKPARAKRRAKPPAKRPSPPKKRVSPRAKQPPAAAQVELLRVTLICDRLCNIKVQDGAGLAWCLMDPANTKASDGRRLDGADPIARVLTEGGELPAGVYGTTAAHTFTIVGPGADVLQIFQMNGKNPWPTPPPKKPTAWEESPVEGFDWSDRWEHFNNVGGGAESVPPIAFTFTPSVVTSASAKRSAR